MQVQDLMNRNVVTLSPNDTFSHAFALLNERQLRSIPVADDRGVYRGMFDLYDIWKVLLPKAATLRAVAVTDLSFLSGTPEGLREKLQAAAGRPVTEFLDDEKSPSIHPEAPLSEAILLLYRSGSTLPVVDRQSRKLLGVVSAWEVLRTLR